MKAIQTLALGLALLAGSAFSQAYPDKSKPLKILVPSGAGSTGDLLARVYARGITEVAGLSVVVENKPGAEGVIGMQAARSAAPDGYTILMTSNSTQVMNPLLMPKLAYDPIADFIPLQGGGVMSIGLWANAALPFASLGEFIAAARQSPERYTYASATTVGRLGTDMLEQMAGIKLLPVLFKTLPEVMTAVSSGQVDVAFGTLSSADAFYKSGRVKPLAVTGKTRMAPLPDTPTVREAGYPDYEITSWLATYAPAKTPEPVVATLRDILGAAGKTKPVQDFLQSFSMQPLAISGDEITALTRSELDKLGRLMRASNAPSR